MIRRGDRDAAVGRELQRVAEQVQDDLLDLLAIAPIGGSRRARVRTARFDRLMIGSSSDITSSISSETPKAVSVSGIRPASMRVMSRMSLMSASRWREFESIRDRLLRCGSVIGPR
jgi:hypothetical protein